MDKQKLSELIVKYSEKEDDAIKHARDALVLGYAELGQRWLDLAEYYRSKANELKSFFP